jgi:Planctomycete cytochrome C
MTRTPRRLAALATVCLFGLIVPNTSMAAVPASPTAAGSAAAARGVLQKYCYQCHGKDGRNEGGLNVVTDLNKLVESKRVVPKDPERSKLLRRVVIGDMPPEFDFDDHSERPEPLRKPTLEEIATLRTWIMEGAINPAPEAAPRRFVSDADILRFIAEDLRKTPPRERRFARYFTLTHLANAGNNEDQLQTYRHGLSKLINSLSWNRKIKAPTPIDPARTVLRIDLRDYLWDDGTWRSVLELYPYGLRPDGVAASPIYELTACELPWVRADWFVYAASRPPLYHQVLQLPATVRELERKLDVDVAANIKQDRVARAAFNASGVSRNNRLIERHESTNGAYWRSYDFGGNADRKNVFAHPLGPGGADGFDHDGGETIFALPNGLHGYMLVDARGSRIDKGPMEIVRDNKQTDGAVVNGVSCMSCHNRGLIEKADQLREVVEKIKTFDVKVAETVTVLYPPREKMDEYFKADAERFAQAVKETGASLSVTEPVFALATQFEEEMNVSLAASESGLEVKDFQDLLSRSPRLGQAMGLLLVGGTVKRDVFADAFPMIAAGRRVPLLNPVGPTGTSAARPPASSRFEPMPDIRTNATGYPADRLVDIPRSFFGPGDGRFREVGTPGLLLAGLRYSTHPFLGRPKVSSLQPLYRDATSGQRLVDGRHYGNVDDPESVVVARPGYAVGAIRTRTGMSLDGCVLIFMRVKGNRLDPSDSYESPVIGDSQGGSPGAASGEGSPVVGVQGRASKHVNAFGLILLK